MKKIRLLLNTVSATTLCGASLITLACSNSSKTETATRTLTNTYWKLTSLGDAPITVYDEHREPYMELQAEPARIAGSDGCNRMMGSYQVNGTKIEFSEMAGTMMACVNGMEQGAAFTKALSQTITWNIDGERLKLFDADAKLLLSFQAAERNTP